MRHKHLIFLLLVVFAIGCIPEPPDYPYAPAEDIVAEAEQISADLTAYIQGWVDGENPAQIPDELIPEGISDLHNFELAHPDSVSAEETWGWRYAAPINLDSLRNSLPDPNVTYLLLGPSFAPMGSTVHIEGEFPHCRFFSLQMTAPLSGEEYNYERAYGGAETSIADVDIDPLPGQTNPFRIGENREAENRSYAVQIHLKTGNGVELSEGQFAPPFRYSGNERNASFMTYQGPWGVSGGFNGITPAYGEWNAGNLWVRMYAPDGDDPLCGVEMPKVYYTLPSGDQYFIKANFDNLLARANATVPAQESNTTENQNLHPDRGWQKSYGILMNILQGVAQVNGWTHPDSLAKIRAVDLGVTGRSQFAPAPRNYEAHATVNNYTAYLGRYLRLDEGEVAVFTGKMPTYPDTRNGLDVMQDAQCRYWSLIGYDNDPFFEGPGSAVNGVMDDEVLLDENRNYMIAFSRGNDQPANASLSNGVTWAEWGPTMDLGMIVRMVTLGEEWNFEQSPTAPSLPWSSGNYASPTYDSTLINQNWHKGYMGCYLPQVHVMSTAQFEALGNDFGVADIPISIHDRFEIGLSVASGAGVEVSSLYDQPGDWDAQNVTDGDVESAWISETVGAGDMEEWLELDLGEEMHISGIKITWNFLNHAQEYDLLVSTDGENYTVVVSEENGNGFNDIHDHLQGVQGRYVLLRMYNPVLFNYGINNLEVYGPCMGCLEDDFVDAIQVDERKKSLLLFPNPSSGELNLKCVDLNDYDSLKIFDQQGALLRTLAVQNRYALQLPSGVYTVVLEGKESRSGVWVVE